MKNTIAAVMAVSMIEILQVYVEEVIDCDCDKCPFYNGYRCLLSGCLGQNDADSLNENLAVYERRCRDAE